MESIISFFSGMLARQHISPSGFGTIRAVNKKQEEEA
jgi:hypothetical protein